MKVDELVSLFKHYAENHVEIQHNDADTRKGFLHLDIEELQANLTNGLKFPSMLLQTPGVEKDGGYDNRSETFEFTFVVLCFEDKKKKPELLTQAKLITDSIFNRLSADAATNDYGEIVGTDEGLFGPFDGGVYGWAVSTALVSPMHGEVVPAEWLDLDGEAP